MTKKHTLKTLRDAGFPLRKLISRYEYVSSVVCIIYSGSDLPLQVWHGHKLYEFDSPTRAARWIKLRLSMHVALVNDYALRTEHRASLRLIVGAA